MTKAHVTKAGSAGAVLLACAVSACFVVAWSVSVWFAPAWAAEDAGQVQRGEAVVTKLCSPCHAVGRSGDSPRAGAPPFRTLSARYPIDALEESLAEGLVSGHPDMPEYQFEASDVGSIIAYLKSVQQP